MWREKMKVRGEEVEWFKEGGKMQRKRFADLLNTKNGRFKRTEREREEREVEKRESEKVNKRVKEISKRKREEVRS